MKNIIVPVDFSSVSLNAMHYAAALAQKLQATILLMHNIQVPVTISEIPVPFENYELLTQSAQQQLDELKLQLNKRYSTITVNTYVSTGYFRQEIEKLAEETSPVLIVMGSEGTGAAEAFMLGSNTLSVAKHLSCPLIIIPPRAAYSGIKKVAYACDMEHEPEVLPGIRDMVNALDAQLEIFYVYDPDHRMPEEVLLTSQHMYNTLSAVRPSVHIVTSKDIRAGIEKFVQDNDVDILLVVAGKHTFPSGLFHESISKKIVLHPFVPVLLMHA
ncbi:universal stress protein [Chitinophagaceae bacterium MMS25-I14]